MTYKKGGELTLGGKIYVIAEIYQNYVMLLEKNAEYISENAIYGKIIGQEVMPIEMDELNNIKKVFLDLLKKDYIG